MRYIPGISPTELRKYIRCRALPTASHPKEAADIRLPVLFSLLRLFQQQSYPEALRMRYL